MEIREELEVEKIKAEVAKLIEDTRKVKKEADWYVAIVASTATLAIVAVTKLFL